MAVLKAEFRRKLKPFCLRVDLQVQEGIHVLFGRSGVGKTQTLECLVGLNRPDSGSIRLGDRFLFKALPGEPIVDVPPRARRIGYVFQDGALFPHKTLLENVMYAIRNHGKAAAHETATASLEEIGLKHLVDSYPSQVSGGQKRRAAIARALVSQPDLLLLDEPFVHLDRVVRSKLMDDLQRSVEEHRLPAILVTHDIDVAAALANTISVLEEGEIIQSGSKNEVLLKPVTGGLARLLGDVNILVGKVTGESSGVWSVVCGEVTWQIPYVGTLEIGQTVEAVIRIGSVKIIKPDIEVPEELSLNMQTVIVETINRRPDFYWVQFKLESGAIITGRIPSDTFQRSNVDRGDQCRISVSVDGISLFPL
jgi:molybdate transport system ATP-binding protein